MVETFFRQELMDREMYPVVGRCWCCGGEIYSMRDLDVYDGMCEECFLATEEDTDNVFGSAAGARCAPLQKGKVTHE